MYDLFMASELDVEKLKEYKLKSILEYALELSNQEKNEIQTYVEKMVPIQLKNYQMIKVEDKKVGCLLVEKQEDGVLLDEIYLEEPYRNKGIGTNMIQNIINQYDTIHLWVYKRNQKAISLYHKLGFQIESETDNRYYMKYTGRDNDV